MRFWWLAALLVLVACDSPSLVIDHRGAPGDPSPRAGASSTYDRANGTIVMFGGADRTGLLGDTWTWDGTTWREQAPTSSPSPREFAFMAFDPATSRVVLFGGETCGPPGRDDPIGCEYQKVGVTQLDDTWSWDGAGWTRLKTSKSPAIFDFRGEFGGMAGDEAHGQVILLTWRPPAPAGLTETWTLSNGDWKRLTTKSSPIAADFSGPAFDAVSGRLIVVQQARPLGGLGRYSVPPASYGDQTWAWTGSDWQPMEISVKTPHSYGQLVEAGAHGVLLLWSNGFYQWNGKVWSSGRAMPESISPAMRPRDQYTAAFHEPTGRLILFGGRAGAGSNHLVPDTAAWDGNSWATVVAAPPSPVMALAQCQPKEALAGYGGGSIVPHEPSGGAMEVDFFEPPSGPCHLHTDVVITLLGPGGVPLKMANNPATHALDSDLTWDVGGKAVVFDAPGICVFGVQVDAQISIGDETFVFPTFYFAGESCPASPPPPTITSRIVSTGLRP